MKKYDVVALGELLVDFINNGVSGQGNNTFEASPGGAPCNVLAMLSKLGKKCAFIGKAGEDIFGIKLKKELEELGICTGNLKTDKNVRTTLAFVENDAMGDRSFSFYRNPGADIMLTEDEVDEELIKSAKIFHFGTLSMTHEPIKSATKKALRIAKESGCIITFDPNLREMLWKSEDDAKEAFDFGMKYCDILKISDNELVWFTGEENYDAGIEMLRNKYKIPLVLLSMGGGGSRSYFGNVFAEESAFLQENTVDTTGAGDTFMGCVINYILENGMEKLTTKNLSEMLVFANAAASVITTRKGALKAMPEKDEIEKMQKTER